MGRNKGDGVLSKQRRRGGYGVGLWRSLRKDWDVVRSRLFFVVGNGQRVKFWKDFLVWERTSLRFFSLLICFGCFQGCLG